MCKAKETLVARETKFLTIYITFLGQNITDEEIAFFLFNLKFCVYLYFLFEKYALYFLDFENYFKCSYVVLLYSCLICTCS
jgi:hypothetical protein